MFYKKKKIFFLIYKTLLSGVLWGQADVSQHPLHPPHWALVGDCGTRTKGLLPQPARQHPLLLPHPAARHLQHPLSTVGPRGEQLDQTRHNPLLVIPVPNETKLWSSWNPIEFFQKKCLQFLWGSQRIWGSFINKSEIIPFLHQMAVFSWFLPQEAELFTVFCFPVLSASAKKHGCLLTSDCFCP